MHTFQKSKQNYVPQELITLPIEAKQWFSDARFGAFIHFGLYSIVGRGEWVMRWKL